MLALSPLRAFAQAPQVKRIRGTVQSVSGDMVTVQTTDGTPVAVKLAPNWSISTIAPLKLDEIKPNDFVGIGASGPIDHLVAIQVVVFPESLRGAGEGHYPWSAQPENSMTNANVAGVVATQAGGRELTLSFKGNSLKISVPPDAPIYRLGTGDRSALVPGAKVVIAATMAGDAVLSASRVTVAIEGANLPI
jgi:hypothetical protein